jgi:hypothetical protein
LLVLVLPVWLLPDFEADLAADLRGMLVDVSEQIVQLGELSCRRVDRMGGRLCCCGAEALQELSQPGKGQSVTNNTCTAKQVHRRW